MEKRVTATEVTERFDDIVERVRASGETLTVERDGKAILLISPPPKTGTVADLAELFRKFPVDPGFAKDVQDGIDWANLCPACYRARLPKADLPPDQSPR